MEYKVSPSILYFCWKSLFDRIQIKENLDKRGIALSTCPHCV